MFKSKKWIRLFLICIAIAGVNIFSFVYGNQIALAEDKASEIKSVDTIYDSISQVWFNEKASTQYFSVSKKGKYGVMNLEGELIVPLKYEQPEENGYQLDGKYGLFQEDGSFIQPISEEPLNFEYGYSRLCVDGKYGIIDLKGNVVIEPKYLDCFIYDKDRIAVKSRDNSGNEYWGIVDTSDKILISPLFKTITKDGIGIDFNNMVCVFGDNLEFNYIAYKDAYRMSANKMAVLSFDGKWGVIDTTAKVIVEPKFDSIEPFDRESFKGIYKIVLKKKYGFMDQNGKILVNPIFYEPSDDEYIPDYMTGDEIYMADAKVGSVSKKGLLNNKGKLLLKPMYDDIIASWYSFDNSTYMAALTGKVWKIYTTNGKYVVEVEKGYQVEEVKGKTVYVVKNKKHFLLDIKTGKHISNTEFTNYANPMESLLTSNGKYSMISNNNAVGMVNNETGKLVLKMQYKDIYSIAYDGVNYPDFDTVTDQDIAVVTVDKNGKCSIYNTKGKLLAKTNYIAIYDFMNGYAAVSTKNKIGFINKKYKLSIDTKYDSALECSEGLFPVKVGGKWGFVDVNDKVVVKPVYDKVESFHDGMARVQKGKKYGFIDKTGKVIIDIVYEDTVGTFTNGVSPVVKAGKLCIIDRNGKEVIETNVKAENNTAIFENQVLNGYQNKVSVYLVHDKDKYGLCIIK